MAPPPKYTEQQITAVVAAILDQNISGEEARRRAAAGTLAAGLPAFTISRDAVSRAKLKAERDRAQAAATNDPRNAANAFSRNMLAALEPSNQALLARARAGKPYDAAIRDRARTLRDLVALQGASERKTSSKKPAVHNEPPPTDLAALLTTQDPNTTKENKDTPQDSSAAQSRAFASPAG